MPLSHRALSLNTGDEDDGPHLGGASSPSLEAGTGAVRTGRTAIRGEENRRQKMDRRGLIGMVAALALAAFMGVSANAANTKTKAKAGCACCGDACSCPACSCDTNSKAGKACDCCGGSTCCSTKAKKTVAAAVVC
jgi:hypothetical protein